MSYQPGDEFALTVLTEDHTGAVNADAPPTGALRRNGVTDAAVTVTIQNHAPGDYTATGAIPAGYAIGDDVELLISATIGGIACRQVVPLGKLDARVASIVANPASVEIDVTHTQVSTSK